MRVTLPVERLVCNLINMYTKRPSMTQTSILLTYRCTQSCRQCAAPNIQTRNPYMRLDDLDIILHKLSRQGTHGVTFSGGDPMLHPQLDECARLAKSFRFLRVHLLTTLYGPENLIDNVIDTALRHRLSISCSFDGYGKLVDELRGASNVAETVERNMRKLDRENRKLRNPVQTGVNITLNAKNLQELPRILDLVKELNWKANIDLYRWASIRQSEHDDLKLTMNRELEEAIELAKNHPNVFTPNWLFDGFAGYMQGNFTKRCPYLELPSFGSKFFINPDGDVEVCIGGSVGNILENTPEEIFTSAKWWRKLRDFRQCKGCWNTCYTLTTGVFMDRNRADILKMARLTYPKVFGQSK